MGSVVSRIGDCGNSFFNNIGVYGSGEFSVIMIGLDQSGKTTMLYKLKLDEIISSLTIGFNVETLQFGRKNITIWDVGGRENLRPLWRHYYPNKNGMVYVIDSVDFERMERAWNVLKKAVEDSIEHGEIKTEERNPVLIFLSKQDVVQKTPIKTLDFIERFDCCEYFAEKNILWYVQECSAMSGFGLFEGFELLLAAMSSPKEEAPRKYYHCKDCRIILKIHNQVRWRPEIHLLFPKLYRIKVWCLILIADRLGLSIDSVKTILSFVPIKVKDVGEMKLICDIFGSKRKLYENIPVISNILKT